MPKLIEQVVCPTCGRHQSLKAGQSFPESWFITNIDYTNHPFMTYVQSYGGQGRGVKGKASKATFLLDHQYNIHEAYAINPARVEAVYRSAKALVTFLEGTVGLHE